MTPDQVNTLRRFAFCFCILLRISIAYAAKIASPGVLTLMGVVALLPAVGFFYLYFFDKRLVGPEAENGVIWWKNQRPVHGAFYLLFAITALAGYHRAYLFLAVDVLFGVGVYLNHWLNG